MVPHLFSTAEHMNYVGPGPDVSYSDVNQMRQSEGKELLSWYDTVTKNEVFHNRQVLNAIARPT